MTGQHRGLLSRIRRVNPDIETMHCIIHREALASKRMSPELHKVLNDSVKMNDRVSGFMKKIELWLRKCEAGDVTSFPQLDRWLSTHSKKKKKTLQTVKAHLDKLSTEFKSYFPDIEDACAEKDWIRNPVHGQLHPQCTRGLTMTSLTGIAMLLILSSCLQAYPVQNNELKVLFDSLNDINLKEEIHTPGDKEHCLKEDLDCFRTGLRDLRKKHNNELEQGMHMDTLWNFDDLLSNMTKRMEMSKHPEQCICEANSKLPFHTFRAKLITLIKHVNSQDHSTTT
ncbi:hypothetical protein AAFF_G00294630 [Aldrovandia affinis]|uniref:Uncharacterized protein n=1 Tax=Aldrovandia affinis TaxID=143900 RepID=A0AAD7R8Y1_9TELE|nr:hypothetical protein AAFF_G00294630 [Aldrovandia affinis]